jgi:hypothetical protein
MRVVVVRSVVVVPAGTGSVSVGVIVPVVVAVAVRLCLPLPRREQADPGREVEKEPQQGEQGDEEDERFQWLSPSKVGILSERYRDRNLG